MYDPKKHKEFGPDKTTVGELIEALQSFDSDTQVLINGDEHFQLHAEQDGSVINLDVNGMEDCYPEGEDIE